MVSPLPAVALLVFSVHVSSCATTHPPQVPQKPIQVLTRALNESPGLSHLTLAFPWVLENPTLLPAKLEGIDWTFEIDDLSKETGTEAARFAVAPKTGDEFNTSITVPLPETSLDQVIDDTVIWKYTFSAQFKITTPNGPSTIVKTWTGELFPPHPPKVSVVAEAARYSDGTHELDLLVTLENPNGFDLRIKEVPYTLLVDGTPVQRGVLGRNQRLRAGTGLEFEVRKTLEHPEHEALIARLRGLAQIPYTFDCQVQLPNAQIHRPFDGILYFE